MLKISGLTYRIGQRTLLDQTSAVIDEGQRVGLVGRNGCGKTTLLGIIAGLTEAQDGEVQVPKRWRIGMTRQEAPDGEASLLDTVIAADRELAALSAEAETAIDAERIATIHARLQDKNAHAAPATAARILAGLGFSEEAQARPCNAFSGGWRMRVALAGLLFTRPDLLLLDEPTNHLDLEATLWLEDYLKSYPGTVMIVSHDRGLLNRAVERILHLAGGTLTLYQGNYDRFEDTRRLKLANDQKQREKQDAQRAHLQAFVDRFRYKASKARQAQSRLKMLARLQPIAEAEDEYAVRFDFPEPVALPSPLCTLDSVAAGYDGPPVLKSLSLSINSDDRIGLLGANGNGKSTLIKLLAGRLQPLSGQIQRSGKLRIGYFAQHQTDELDVTATPVDEVARRRPRDGEAAVRGYLGRFGFSQARALTTIGNLSGGEKARLLFALMASAQPHILLLDEPTNHLDMQSREALVAAMTVFPGAVIIVSHDPHVLSLTADRFWLVDRGRVDPFDGDMDDYRAYLETRAGEGTAPAAKAAAESGKIKRHEQRKLQQERRAKLAPLKRQLQGAETVVERLEAERARVAASMADPRLYDGDPRRIVELQSELGRLDKDIALAEAEWGELQEAWDAAQADAAE